jgi:hypothetical protein
VVQVMRSELTAMRGRLAKVSTFSSGSGRPSRSSRSASREGGDVR